jgi:hypothetical protein
MFRPYLFIHLFACLLTHLYIYILYFKPQFRMVGLLENCTWLSTEIPLSLHLMKDQVILSYDMTERYLYY